MQYACKQVNATFHKAISIENIYIFISFHYQYRLEQQKSRTQIDYFLYKQIMTILNFITLVQPRFIATYWKCYASSLDWIIKLQNIQYCIIEVPKCKRAYIRADKWKDIVVHDNRCTPVLHTQIVIHTIQKHMKQHLPCSTFDE